MRGLVHVEDVTNGHRKAISFRAATKVELDGKVLAYLAERPALRVVTIDYTN